MGHPISTCDLSRNAVGRCIPASLPRKIMDTLGNEDTMPTPLKADQIDALFAGWDAPGAPGGTLAVLRGGAVVHQRCFGLASLELRVKNGPETRFHIASITKTFVAAASALLVESGKLSSSSSSCEEGSQAVRTTSRFRVCSSPPPTEKTMMASLSLALEISSQAEKVVSHPSSLVRAVSSETLSVGA